MNQPDRLGLEKGADENAIDVQSFLRNFERQLGNPVPGILRSDTPLRDLPDWTSLRALIVVASFDSDYGVTVSADEFSEAETVRDLYALVIRKMHQ